jgi:YNFM family putative membrane transporter
VKNLTHYHRIVLAICLCSIVTFSNIYWLQPLLPLLQHDFHITPLAASLSMSAPLLGMGLGLLFFASWSDAIGRCKILLCGTAIGLGISILLPIIENYTVFLVMRFVQGMFLAVCPAVAVPLLGEELRKSWLAAAVGLYVASNTVGGISSRLLGGMSAEYLQGWASAGYVIGALSLILFLVVWMVLPQQRHFKPATFKVADSLAAFAEHLKRPQLVLIYLLIGLAFGCFVNQFNYLMIVLGDAPYHMPSDVRSFMFLTLLGGTTSSSLVGRFSQKYSLATGVIVGICIMLFANLLLGLNHVAAMVLGMVLMSVGFFFCHAQASTLVGRSVSKSRGSALALYSLFYYSGASLGVFLLDPFYKIWGWHGVLGSTRIALALCIVWIVLYQLVDMEKKKAIHTA